MPRRFHPLVPLLLALSVVPAHAEPAGEAAPPGREDGRVVVQATVGPDGKTEVEAVLYESDPGRGLKEAALEAVRGWRYEPPPADGAPLTVYFTLEVELAPAKQSRGSVPAPANPEPRLIERVPPDYPKAARAERIEGRVTLQAVIDEKGRVTEVVVLDEDPPGKGFGKAAARAVRKWRYEPATEDGKPVRVFWAVNIEFTLP